jgi:hypothetical protein
MNAPAKSPAKSGLVRSHTVRLSIDGNIAGHLNVMDHVGSVMPVRATITVALGGQAQGSQVARTASFAQPGPSVGNGQIVATVRSDEFGNFQISGLGPGVYSVVAQTGSLYGVFSLAVLEYDPNAPREEMTLNLTLVAAEEELSQGEEILPPYGAEPYGMTNGFGGGGGGGGGGGFGLGLVGLAALAGLAGIGDGGGDSALVSSPFFPGLDPGFSFGP